MLKNKFHILPSLIVLLTMFVLIVALGATAMAATITTTGTGNWSSTVAGAPWPGGTIPAATDDIVIGAGFTLTVDGNRTCNSMTIGNGSTVSVSSGILLTVTAAITFPDVTNANVTGTIAGAGSATAASLAVGTNVTPTGTRTTNWTSTINSLTISGNLTLTSSYNTTGPRTENAVFNHTSGTITVNGSVTTVNANAGNTSTYTMGATSPTLVLGGATPFIASGTGTSTFTLNGTGATVNYSYAGAQTVQDVAYMNLTTSGSGTKTWTLVAARTVAGNLSVGTGSGLTTNGNNTLGVTGTTSVTGTLTLGGTSAKTFTSNVTINALGVWNETGVAAINYAGNLQNDGTTFTANTGVHTFTGTGKTISGASTLAIPSLTISGTTTNSGTLTVSTALAGASTLTNTGTLNIGGTSSITTLTAAASGNTVDYNSSTGAQTIIGSMTYYNLTVDKAGQVGTIGAAITVSNNLSVLNGTLADGGFQITGNGTGTLNVAAGATLQIGAAGANMETFPTLYTSAQITLNATSTVIYNSTSAMAVAGSITSVGPSTYGNLTLSSASTKTAASAISVAGNLTINAGTFSDGGSQITGNGTGTLSVANGATLQIGAGTAAITSFPANFTTANITLNPTSTVNYNTITNAQNVAGSVISAGPSTYGHLTITGASGTKTMTGAITVAGNLTIATAGETFADGGFTITVNGNVTNNATHSGAGEILLSGGAGSHTVTGTTDTYGTLELNDANGATFANTAATTTVGTLTVTSGTLTLNSFTTGLTVTTTNVIGTLAFNNATGTRTMGAVTVNTGGVVNITTAPSSLTVSDLTDNGIWNNSINAAVSIGGNLTVNTGSTFTAGSGAYTFTGIAKTIGGTLGTISIPSISISASVTNNLTTVPGLNISTTFAGAGTLSQGTNAILTVVASPVAPTLTAATAGNTVNYSGAAQTAKVTSYFNLTLSGSGIKTFATTPTVNGVLSLEGTATVTVTAGVITYGPNATLQYNKLAAYTATAEEWITPFAATGGIIIANTGAITTYAALTLSAGVPLTINSGSTLITGATNTWTLTVGGTTSVSGTLTLANTGTKTFTGAVTINSGGAITETAAGQLVFGSDVTIGGTLTENGAAVVGFGGNFTNNGTYTASTGNHTFSGTNNTIGGTANPTTIPTATFTGAYTNNCPYLSITTSLTVTGVTLTNNTTIGAVNISGTGRLTQGNNAALSIGGTSTIAALTATANGNTVNYFIGGQTVYPTNYYNLTLSGTGANTLQSGTTTISGNLTLSGTATATTVVGLTIGGNLSIGNGTSFTSNAAYALTVAGTTTVGGGTSGTLAIATTATNTQTFTGVVTINSGANFTESVAAALSFGSDIADNGTLSFGPGILNISGNLYGTGTVTGGAGSVNIAGNWTQNGTFTANTSTVNYNGNYIGQIVRGGITYYNLQISNGGSKLLQAGNATVSNVLTLNSGVFKLNDYNLILSNTSTGAMSGTYDGSNMIETNGIGYLQKAGAVFNNGAGIGFNIVYPIGAGGFYNPLDLTSGFTATAGTGTLQIRAVSVNQGANALNKYWTLTISSYTGIITNLRFTYDVTEVHGTQSTYAAWYSAGTWGLAAGIRTALGADPFGTNVSGVTAASISGNWSAGTSAPGSASAISYYSYQSGDWADATSWTTDPSGTLWINPGVPGTLDNVTVLNGRTISINSNTIHVASLTLNAGGILNINSTTGHNFGTVTGQGKIMLSSNTFPGGTYTSFIASNGGTIEYYNLNAVSLNQLTYNNLIISNYTSIASSTFLNNGTNPTTYTINGNFSLKNYSSGAETVSFGNPAASDNLINMTVYGNFSVDAGCNIRVNNFAASHAIPNPTDNVTVYPVHTLSLYGNFTNNGSVRFTGLPSPVANGYYILAATAFGGVNYGDVQVFFYGSANNSVICNGTTDFFRLIEAKGVDNTFILEVTSSNLNNFALYGPNFQGGNTFDGGSEGFGYGAYYKALFLHYGTLKLDANINIPSLTEGGQDFNIIPTAELWINGANVSTTVAGVNGTGYQAATLYGSLRISAGQFSTGDAAGIVLGALGAPSITVEGTGTLDVSQAWTNTGAANQMSYTQTGGTANFRLQGENHAGPMLALANANSVFTMSGGVMNFPNNAFIDATIDYQIMTFGSQVGNYKVTGGTINLNLPSSATPYTASSTVPFYNLNITNQTGSGTLTIQWNTPSPLSVLNDLTIGSNSVLDLSTNAIDLAVGHNFNIPTGAVYTHGAANTTTFNGTGVQSFNNTGTITGGTLYNLTITNTSVTSIITNNLTVTGTLLIDNNATLNDSGKYIYAAGDIVINGTHTGQQTAGGIRLNGTVAQTISGGGNGIFNNLIIDKSNTSGVSLLANASITGSLRLLNNANFNVGSNNLAFGPQANVYTDMLNAQNFDNAHMIYTNGLASDLGVSKTYNSSNKSFIYPLGAGTSYRPARIQFTADPSQYGSISIRPILSAHPLIQSAGHAITLYWKTISTGFSGIQNNSINQVYYYYAADAPTPSDEVNYIPAVYIAPNWNVINDTSTVLDYKTPREIHFNTTNYIDGEYTCGIPAAFSGLMTYYSNSNNSNVTSPAGADWSTAGTWCTGSNTGTATGALADNMSNAVFVIGDGSSTTHKITISGVHQIHTGNISILSDGILDIGLTNGHNFGGIPNSKVTGSGTLRIASSGYFPIGDWGSFLGNTGGTVEYYQTSTSPATINMPVIYTLPGGSTVNITGYFNLIISPYNASNIILPNTNLSVYNNFTIGFSAGGGTANCITQINAGAASTTLEVHGNININQYGMLQYMNNAAENIIADNDINIAAGGAFQVRNGGTSVANTLTVYGNIVNNGTLDMDPNYPTNDTYYCILMFAGSLNKALTSTSAPARTRLYNIGVNKGAAWDSVLNVNIDPTGFLMGGGGLNLQNGTFRLTTNVAMNISAGAFTIPSTSCLSANGGTLNIATGTAAAADLTLNGKLEILAGTVNIGPAISTASAYAYNIVYATAGAPVLSIASGALNVYSQIRRQPVVTSGALNYMQTGGTVTIGAKNPNTARAAFEVVNTGSSFVMSGGTIIIASHISTAPPYDLDLESDGSSVSGGTIQLGLAGVTANSTLFYFQSSDSIGNLILESTTNASAIQEIYALTMIGNLTIGGASGTFSTNGLDLEIGGNLTNNNTNASTGLTVGGFQAGKLTQTTSFLGNNDQFITGTASNRTNFANLEIATASTDTLYLANNSGNIIVNGDLTLTSGTLNDGSNSIYLLNNVNNNAVHVSPNTTTGGMVFIGTINQGVTGSGYGIFGNIEINNGVYGVNMTDNSTINGQFKFTSGYFYIDNYLLTLGQSAAIAGTLTASNLILLNGVLSDEGVKKIFPAGATSFTFPIGDNGKYTPCTFNFASNSNAAGTTIKVIPVDQLHPSINPALYTNYLNYYWNVVTTGFSSAYSVTHTYTYLPADLTGNPLNIERCDNTSSQWTIVTGSIISPTFSFTSTSYLDGGYTIGDPFMSLPTATSQGSGNWNLATLWSTGSVPNGNPVIIRSSDSIALSVNNAYAASVQINGVLDTKNTTFHNLGQVSGTGKLKLLGTSSGSYVFPGGSYDVFLANPLSTIEFYGNTNSTLPSNPGDIYKPYQNVVLSGTGIKYISSINMKINGNLIISPNSKLDNTPNNKDLTILGNWIDQNTVTSGFNAGTGTIYFSGTTAQKIVMANSSMTEPFYNLAINNTSGLTLQTGNADINNQLILTTGYITTSNANNLTIQNTSTSAVSGGGVNSFVNGPLRKNIANGSNFQFPVGDTISSGRKRIGYISVTNTATSGNQIWTAQYFDKNPSIDGYDITKVTQPIISVVNNEYWNIIGPSAGSPAANVALNWDQYTGMNSDPLKRVASGVAEWNTPVLSSWNSVGAVVTDKGQDSGTVATSTLVSLGNQNHIFTISTRAPLFIATLTGLWNNPLTWGGAGVPGLNDAAEISSGITVTLNVNTTITKFTIDNSGGTFNDSTNTLTLTGNLELDGTWTGSGGKISMTSSTGTIFGSGVMQGTCTLEIAGIKGIDATANLTLTNVSILTGNTLNNNGNITVNSLSGADATSIFNNLSGSTLTINGPLMSTAGTLHASSCPNVVIYNGTSAQTVNPATYCTLRLNNTGVKTVSADFNVNNEFYIISGSNLTVGSGVVIKVLGRTYVAGALTNNGNILISN
jgi:hypothetical protein